MATDDRTVKRNELVTEWVTRLGISDWDITVLPDCTKQEVTSLTDGCDAAGAISWSTLNKRARILILSEEEFDNLDEDTKWISDFDYEIALVHELLHIKFAPLWDSFDNQFVADWFHQQGIEDMARALVGAKRAGVIVGQHTVSIDN